MKYQRQTLRLLFSFMIIVGAIQANARLSRGLIRSKNLIPSYTIVLSLPNFTIANAACSPGPSCIGQSFTLTNHGPGDSGTLSYSGLSVPGFNGISDVYIPSTTCGTTLAANTSCYFELTDDGDGIEMGGCLQVTVSISGNGASTNVLYQRGDCGDGGSSM